MEITIGSDHRGYEFKQEIQRLFTDVEWIDVGTQDSLARVDYPEFAQKACELVLSGEAKQGILICGSGVGMSIAANRYKKIYGALCWNETVARVAREHDCANVSLGNINHGYTIEGPSDE